MRAVVGIQRDHVLGAEPSRQARRPSFQCQLGHEQRLASFVDGPLDEAQHATHGPQAAIDDDGLLLQGDALARARALPARGGIAAQPCGAPARLHDSMPLIRRVESKPESSRTRIGAFGPPALSR